jgi:hypothetical protein
LTCAVICRQILIYVHVQVTALLLLQQQYRAIE